MTGEKVQLMAQLLKVNVITPGLATAMGHFGEKVYKDVRLLFPTDAEGPLPMYLLELKAASKLMQPWGHSFLNFRVCLFQCCSLICPLREENLPPTFLRSMAGQKN